MEAIFLIWEENVLSAFSILWSSPISTNIFSKIDIEVPFSAGISIPHCVIKTRMPTVFSVTVFPPALGPVIIKFLYFSPISKSRGTISPLSSGCLAFTNLI